MHHNHIIIFIKNPVAGKVKTRIAVTAGEEAALEIYKKLLDITMFNTLACNALRYLYYSDVIDNHDAWSNQHFIKAIQVSGDLGHKMKSAFCEVFQDNIKEPSTKVIIIGSDCPKLSPQILEQAYIDLETHDIVIGPSFDGGYYLLGMKDYWPTLFDDVTWSTDTVLAQTIHHIEKLNLSWTSLPTLNDIDTEKDWLDYQGWHNKEIVL